MKKSLLFVVVFAALYSCKTSTPPKEIAKQFIWALSNGDVATANSLATEKTKASIPTSHQAAVAAKAEENFSLNTLTENINGNSAEVKNDVIKLSLEKEGDGWMVNATPDVVATITNRQNDLASLQSKWDELVKEYNARLQLAKEYVDYKKSQGNLSAPVQSLNEMITTLSAKTDSSKEQILLYGQRQKQLAELIDKSIEPSFTANADLGMNYILQLSNANDRIKAAQSAYNSLAQKTPSNRYPVLP